MKIIHKVKEHVKEHKEAYITGVTVAGITYLIMRDQRLFCGEECAKEVLRRSTYQNTTIMGSNFVGGNNYGTVTNNHVPRGLSYIVSQDGTNNWWISQADYAREKGLFESTVSMHCNHGRPLPNGESLSRRGVANATG
jgi:hypothetical protein